jgi:RNA polymerase sigma-70 factor, ECF subfamily
MKKLEEAYLLKKLNEGDIGAFELIFKMHYANLCRYLLMLFKNQSVIDHIAQDVFVYIWENRETITIKTSIRSYLYSAGRYKAINQIRNLKRHEQIEESFAVKEFSENTTERMVELKDLDRIVNDAIKSLPARCQQIFRLSRDQDLSYKEIAQMLDLSVNTVENQMSIALKKLRGILRPFYLQLFFSF